MDRNSTITLLATVSYAGVLLVNALASWQPLNGLTTKQVSDLYPNLFTPSGITFSIWSVIYLLLIGFLILAWLRQDSVVIEKILPWFIISCFLNMSWIVLWHFLFPLFSVLVMLCLLAILFRIFILIHTSTKGDQLEKTFVVLPFTVYLAWICVATIANVAALFVHWNLVGGESSQETWTIVMMAIAVGISILSVRRYNAWAFAVVILWALFGICLRWESGEHPSIVFSAIILMVGLISFTVYWLFKSRRSDYSA